MNKTTTKNKNIKHIHISIGQDIGQHFLICKVCKKTIMDFKINLKGGV
jgi:hypothetical protein